MKPETYAVERALAPAHWWFEGRRRILASLLAAEPLPASARILDVGSGTGANVGVLAAHGEVVAVDASRRAFRSEPVDSARADSMPRTAPGPGERGESRCRRALQGRLEALPLRDRAFDLVTALDVLEHLDDDVGAAREIRRVLAPQGRLLVFVPALELLWGLQDEVSEHRRRYTARSLRRTLETAGLRIRRLSYFNTLLFPAVLAGRLAMRLFRPPVRSENELTPAGLDRILTRVFAAEAPLLARANLPVGVSLLAVAGR